MAGTVDHPAEHVELPARPGAGGTRRRRREVHVSAVAAPHCGLRPDAAVGPDLRDHLVGSPRPLLDTAEIIHVQEVDDAFLPRQEHHREVALGRLEARGQCGRAAGAEVAVERVQLLGVSRAEPVGDGEAADDRVAHHVGGGVQLDHALSEPLGLRAADRRAGRGCRAVAGRIEEVSGRVDDRRRARLPDSGSAAAVLAGLVGPHAGDGARGRDSDDPAEIRRIVAVAAESGVDHAVHECQSCSLHLELGMEHRAGIVGRGALDLHRKPGLLDTRADIDRVHVPSRRRAVGRGRDLRREVGDVRRRIDHRRRGDADLGREIAAREHRRVERGSVVVVPVDGTGHRVDAVRAVVLGHREQRSPGSRAAARRPGRRASPRRADRSRRR